MPENEPTATLIISRSYSQCGGCGQQTLPRTEYHDRVSGYTSGQPGCGARFVAVTSDQVGSRGRAWCAQMRPDLPWVDYADRARPEVTQDAGAAPQCVDCGEPLAHSGCTAPGCDGWACVNVTCGGDRHCLRDRAGWDACRETETQTPDTALEPAPHYSDAPHSASETPQIAQSADTAPDMPDGWMDAVARAFDTDPHAPLVPAVIRAVRPLIETDLTTPLRDALAASRRSGFAGRSPADLVRLGAEAIVQLESVEPLIARIIGSASSDDSGDIADDIEVAVGADEWEQFREVINHLTGASAPSADAVEALARVLADTDPTGVAWDACTPIDRDGWRAHATPDRARELVRRYHDALATTDPWRAAWHRIIPDAQDRSENAMRIALASLSPAAPRAIDPAALAAAFFGPAWHAFTSYQRDDRAAHMRRALAEVGASGETAPRPRLFDPECRERIRIVGDALGDLRALGSESWEAAVTALDGLVRELDAARARLRDVLYGAPWTAGFRAGMQSDANHRAGFEQALRSMRRELAERRQAINGADEKWHGKRSFLGLVNRLDELAAHALTLHGGAR